MIDLPVIALLIESSTAESHWRRLLAGVNCRIVTGDELATSGSRIDIVVTDGRQTPEAGSLQGPAAMAGVIGIVAEFPADVVFASDPTGRELPIACDLLYEVVKLRRERASSQRAQRLLTEMAELDGLTGLANRRAWDAELAGRMKCAGDVDAPLCLALFDLDHFKEVNTTHGYAAADEVLQHAGSALQAGVRAGDFVARIGGDEFGVLLSQVSDELVESVVERIRASIKPVLAQSGSAVVTATAGVAVRRPHHDAGTLFATADANLRRGKSAGRNRTVAEHVARLFCRFLAIRLNLAGESADEAGINDCAD